MAMALDLRYIFRVSALFVVCACTGCPDPDPGPAPVSLDDALDEFLRIQNETAAIVCACPNTVGSSDGPFATEQECLDAVGKPIDESNLTCMKDVLATIYANEDDSARLIECYNAAKNANNECRRANIESCSNAAALHCVDVHANAIDACDGSLTFDTLEPLFLCAQS